jgi:hypothetical protein
MTTKALTDLRWVGVSGLAVGALAVMPDAEAAIIIGDAVGGKVGFGAGFGATYSLNLPGAASIGFTRGSGVTGGGNFVRQIYVNGAGGSQSNAIFRCANGGVNLALAVAGQKWADGVGTGSTNSLGGTFRKNTTGGSAVSHAPNAGYANKYLLFQFNDSSSAGAVRHGWAEMSLAIGASTGPDVTIHRWAYDDSGAEILAGAVPEPATAAAATGMALVMGAAGLRAWRKQRQPKA